MGKLGYISVNLDKETEKELSREIADLDLHPVSEYPFHVTMMFDESECDEPRCVINPEATFEAVIIGFKPLGDAVVAELHSIGLQREFKRLKEAGYNHSFPSLLLHMSLVYNPDDYALLVLEKGLERWIGKTITLTNETLRNCQ